MTIAVDLGRKATKQTNKTLVERSRAESLLSSSVLVMVSVLCAATLTGFAVMVAGAC